MVREVRARGVSVTTARYAAAVLGIALRRARKERRVVQNVVELVDLPKPVQRESTPLSAEQARALVESVAAHRFGPLFTVAIATGMRQGELLGLRWQDVDLDAGYLHIRHPSNRGPAYLPRRRQSGVDEPWRSPSRLRLPFGSSAVVSWRLGSQRTGVGMTTTMCSRRPWVRRSIAGTSRARCTPFFGSQACLGSDSMT